VALKNANQFPVEHTFGRTAPGAHKDYDAILLQPE
jgi:hypothetical protein